MVPSIIHWRRPARRGPAPPLGFSGIRHRQRVPARSGSGSDFSPHNLWPGAGGGLSSQALPRTRTGQAIPSEAHEVFGHPFAIALLAALLLSTPFTQSAPLSIVSVIYLLWIGLLARLTPILVNAEMRPPVYLLLGLNLLELLRSVVPLGIRAAASRAHTADRLPCSASFGWLTRPARLRLVALSKWPRLVILIATRAGLLLIAVALIANVFGFVSLSRVLGVGTLLSAFLATGQYFVVRIALLALSILLESPWLSYLAGDIREAIHLWGRRILVLIASHCLVDPLPTLRLHPPGRHEVNHHQHSRLPHRPRQNSVHRR